MSADFLTEGLRLGAIGELDAHFAAFLAAHGSNKNPNTGAGTQDPVALAAACVSQATAQGHVCVDLAALANTVLWPGTTAPELGEWQAALQASGTLATAERPAPLVLEDSLLYLNRYWRYEIAVAENLRARAQTAVLPFDEAALAAALARRFPLEEGIDHQKIAAAVAVMKSLAVISGGPGTGKTTTVLKVLAILAELSPHPLRMAMAAPTGKAASRLQEALRAGRRALDLPPQIDAQLPTEALTLHRLLGSRPGRVQFKHHRANPLAFDVLVVDEASMIDIALMAKLLDALAPTTRLIILGDKDQLASVEAGAVLHSICAQAGDYSAPMAERLYALTGYRAEERSATTLSDNIVFLSRSYRFDPRGGIGALAASSLRGDADAAIDALSGQREALRWSRPADYAQMIEHLSEAYIPLFEAAQSDADPVLLLEIARRFAVLCAYREGQFGTININDAIEKHLRRRGLIATQGDWYAGRPVMMQRNDYSLRLFNGEIGLTVRDAAGELGVFFPAADGGLKRFAAARLTDCDTAFAMTVHKAQGSEFDAVAVVLPRRSAPILSRELFYTAVTRAARAVHIFADEEIIRGALAQSVTRRSALSRRLGDK